MTEQDSNNNQQTFLTANHKKEMLKVSQMSPAQKFFYLNVKQRDQHLTPDEKHQLEELKNDKEIEVNPNRDLKKSRPKEPEDINDIFKEEDILEAMYKGILLDGLNWLFKKTYKYTVKGTDWLADKIWNGGRQVRIGFKEGRQANANGRNDAMSNFTNTVDNHYLAVATRRMNTSDNFATEQQKKIDRYVAGTPKDDEKNSLLYQTVCKMNNREKQNFADTMKDATQNLANTVRTIEYMAATLTRTQFIQNGMNKNNIDSAPNQILFEAQTKINAILIAKQLDRAPSSLDMLFNGIEKANKTVNKSMDRGKYKSNNKKWFNKPKANKALTDINEIIGLDSEGKMKPTTDYTDNSENSPVERFIRTNHQYSLDQWAQYNIQRESQQQQSIQNNTNNSQALQNQEKQRLQRLAHLYQKAARIPVASNKRMTHIVKAVNKANDNLVTRYNTRSGNGGAGR